MIKMIMMTITAVATAVIVRIMPDHNRLYHLNYYDDGNNDQIDDNVLILITLLMMF